MPKSMICIKYWEHLGIWCSAHNFLTCFRGVMFSMYCFIKVLRGHTDSDRVVLPYNKAIYPIGWHLHFDKTMLRHSINCSSSFKGSSSTMQTWWGGCMTGTATGSRCMVCSTSFTSPRPWNKSWYSSSIRAHLSAWHKSFWSDQVPLFLAAWPRMDGRSWSMILKVRTFILGLHLHYRLTFPKTDIHCKPSTCNEHSRMVLSFTGCWILSGP